jgi:hypothetical protein
VSPRFFIYPYFDAFSLPQIVQLEIAAPFVTPTFSLTPYRALTADETVLATTHIRELEIAGATSASSETSIAACYATLASCGPTDWTWSTTSRLGRRDMHILPPISGITSSTTRGQATHHWSPI